MFEVKAKWNQSCRSLSGAATLYLGVRIRPVVASRAAPVHIVVLLDVSTSMDGEKLEQAKQAVQAVWEQLNPGDRLSLLTFSTRVGHCLDWAEKGCSRSAEVMAAIENCEVEGVTLLDDGLREAIALAGGAPATDSRFVWLVTDGNPTDRHGRKILDLDPYVAAATEAARQGVVVGALGLGDARNYRHQFLRDLADHGQGAFCYAPDPHQLAAKLSEQLRSVEAVAATRGRIEASFEDGTNLLSAARVVPEYMPLDLPDGQGSWSLALGPISTPETIIMLEVAHTAFGLQPGSYHVGDLKVSAFFGRERYEAAVIPLNLELASVGSRKVFGRDATMENMRIAFLISRNAQFRANTDDLAEKVRATEEMADLVRETGDMFSATHLEAEAQQLREGLSLSPEQEAQDEANSRRTGPMLLLQELNQSGRAKE
jgi:Mg-chelatase subunit ChlD